MSTACGAARSGLLVVALLMAGSAGPVRAQLISPGKLTAAHADLEGIRNCTQCHELRERGVANAKCLACHEPLRTRIDAGRGFHAGLADRNCAECHKDHFGSDFQAIRFDTAGFDHQTAGYELVGAHAQAACRDCHRADWVEAADVLAFKRQHGALEHTFLGLPETCTACHATDDPHEGRFSDRACDECHVPTEWSAVDTFDHSALDVGAAGTTCASCHAPDDPHGSQFGERSCDACHGVSGWSPAETFDHGATRYRLTGRHRRVECAECHRPARDGAAAYVGVEYARCTACHTDVHEGAMPDACRDCHTTASWLRIDRPLEGLFDHSVATGYDLEGAHVDLECAACHASAQAVTADIRMTFQDLGPDKTFPRPAAENCRSCHVDYHDGVFADAAGGAGCDGCHGQAGWIPTSYDMTRHNTDATFVLVGAHVAVPCSACHVVTTADGAALQFTIAEQDCLSCHRPDDPHAGQFGDQDCSVCHGQDSFDLPSFDHTETRYALDGAHQDVPCAGCHTLRDVEGTPVRIYRPLGMECRDCHEDER